MITVTSLGKYVGKTSVASELLSLKMKTMLVHLRLLLTVKSYTNVIIEIM